LQLQLLLLLLLQPFLRLLRILSGVIKTEFIAHAQRDRKRDFIGAAHYVKCWQ